jgi:hypothetical protein
MTWLAPWAFGAAIVLAGPLLVHMLLRRNARRIRFPATHFLTATRASAVRFRRPSDPWLLLLRLLIIAAAIAGVARPLFLTPWRTSQWDARVSRAVVVDTRRGMPSPEIAAGLAQQEMTAAFHAQRFAGADLRETFGRAAAWIAGTPPSRREIVVISDFPRGSFDAAAIAAMPADVGVRMVRAGRQPPERSVAPPPVEGWRGALWQPALTIDADTTRATWTRQRPVDPPSWLIPVAPAADAAAADRALRAAASFGVNPGDATRRVTVIFTGGRYQGGTPEPVRTQWMVPVVLALRDSRLLREAGVEVTTGESDGALVIDTRIAAASASAPAVLRAVMLAARPLAVAHAEAETATLPDADLAAWARPPAAVTGRVGVAVDEGDARWFWTTALILLLLEGWVRSAPRRPAALEKEVEHADAA